MKRVLYNKYRRQLAGITVLFSLTVACFLSCQKKIDPEALHVNGVFQGENCNRNPVPPVTVNLAGNSPEDSNIIIQGFSICDTGACKKAIDLPATVNKGYLSFGTQYLVDGCNDSIVLTGAGTLTGHNIYYNAILTYKMKKVNGKDSVVKKCFFGAK